MGLTVANASPRTAPTRKTTNDTMTNDTKGQEKHQQKRIHKLLLNTDRLGLARTQGGNWFHRAIESG